LPESRLTTSQIRFFARLARLTEQFILSGLIDQRGEAEQVEFARGLDQASIGQRRARLDQFEVGGIRFAGQASASVAASFPRWRVWL